MKLADGSCATPRFARRSTATSRSGSSTLGELVKAQTPVMSVVRVDPLKVIAEIPEKMAPWIKDGQPVELHVDAYPDRHVRRQGVAHQPGGQHRRRARFRSRRWCRTRTRC